MRRIGRAGSAPPARRGARCGTCTARSGRARGQVEGGDRIEVDRRVALRRRRRHEPHADRRQHGGAVGVGVDRHPRPPPDRDERAGDRRRRRRGRGGRRCRAAGAAGQLPPAASASRPSAPTSPAARGRRPARASASSRRFSSSSSTTRSGARATIAVDVGVLRAADVSGSPAARRTGCRRRRRTPRASNVSVADGTRLTTRIGAGPSAQPRRRRFCSLELLGRQGAAVEHALQLLQLAGDVEGRLRRCRAPNMRSSLSSIWEWIRFCTRSGLRMSVKRCWPSSAPDSISRSPAPSMRSMMPWWKCTLLTRSSGISMPLLATRRGGR